MGEGGAHTARLQVVLSRGKVTVPGQDTCNSCNLLHTMTRLLAVGTHDVVVLQVASSRSSSSDGALFLAWGMGHCSTSVLCQAAC